MGHTDARRFRAPCPTLLILAAIYSGHPGYRKEWGEEYDDRPWSSGPSLVELDAYGDFAPERSGQ